MAKKPQTTYIWDEDFDETISQIPDEHQQLLMYKAITPYALHGVIPHESIYTDRMLGQLDAIFVVVRKNQKRYEEKCETNAENGRKGGKATQANRAKTSDSSET